MFLAALVIIVKNGNNPYPSTDELTKCVIYPHSGILFDNKNEWNTDWHS